MTETVNSKESLEVVIDLIRQTFDEYKYIDVEIKIKGKARTNKQNAAMHKYFSLLADSLNNAGYDMKKTIKAEVDIPWTPDLVKEYMWRPIQKAVIGEESTTRAKTKDYPLIYETLNRHTAGKLGISVPWPSVEGE